VKWLSTIFRAKLYNNDIVVATNPLCRLISSMSIHTILELSTEDGGEPLFRELSEVISLKKARLACKNSFFDERLPRIIVGYSPTNR
jgi:hypothetical protein